MNDTARSRSSGVRPKLHLREQALGYLAVVLALTLIAPYRSDDFPFLVRLAYWGVNIGLGWGLILGGIVAMQRVPATAAWPPFKRVLVAVTCAAVPTAVGVLLIDRWLGSGAAERAPLALVFNAAVLFIVIAGVVVSLMRPKLVAPAPVPASNPFLNRLSPGLGTALISVSAQDHYVDVVTARGRELIHMRLSDAVEELDGYPGAQIHRSHWISGHAFTGLSREAGKLVAHLVDGRTLPVSRSFAPVVRQMQPVRPRRPPRPKDNPVSVSEVDGAPPARWPGDVVSLCSRSRPCPCRQGRL